MNAFVRLAILTIFLMWAPSVTLAHAAMVKADPGPRAVTSQSPATIRLWFNEPVEEAFANVMLETDGGIPVKGLGKPTVDPVDKKLLVVPVPELPPGLYKVKYKVLSVDGHIVDWGYSFRVQGTAQENE
jgi:methionine-rich copper-binding protein CopC